MRLKINESESKPVRVKISGENFLSLDFGTCLKNYFDSLNESSLKRVLKHQNDFGMVMISASRRFEDVKSDVASMFPDYSDLIENEEPDVSTGLPVDETVLRCFNKYLEKRNNSLRKDIESLGLGYIRTVGGFREGDVDVVEMSFLIPYAKTNMTITEFVGEFLKLCAKYNQDSILVKYPEDDHVFYVDRNGNEDMVFDSFRYNDMAVYFSYLLKGKDRGKKWEYIKTESIKKDIKCFDYLATYKAYDIRERAMVDGRHEIYLRDFSK